MNTYGIRSWDQYFLKCTPFHTYMPNYGPIYAHEGHATHLLGGGNMSTPSIHKEGKEVYKEGN